MKAFKPHDFDVYPHYQKDYNENGKVDFIDELLEGFPLLVMFSFFFEIFLIVNNSRRTVHLNDFIYTSNGKIDYEKYICNKKN